MYPTFIPELIIFMIYFMFVNSDNMSGTVMTGSDTPNVVNLVWLVSFIFTQYPICRLRER